MSLNCKMRSTSIASLTCFACLFSQACIRYTPSQEEIVSSPDTVVASEEAFFGFEKSQRTRLLSIIESRSKDSMSLQNAGYEIGPGDLIQISVFDVPELNRSVRVRPSGQISLPLIGVLDVKGLSEGEVQDKLSKKLLKFLHAPQVNVFIEEYAAYRVSVIGEVNKPGPYALRRNDYSIMEVLSEAGGRTKSASGRILLIPGNQDQLSPNEANLLAARQALSDKPMAESGKEPTKGIEIVFDDLVGSANKVSFKVPLRPGDTIIVPEAGSVEVDGDVNTPGSYQLSSRMTLLGAVAAGGGLTYSSNVHAAEVIRELEDGRKAIIIADLEKVAAGEASDVLLRDGDIVRVPSAGGRFATRQIVEGINSILSFGFSAAP